MSDIFCTAAPSGCTDQVSRYPPPRQRREEHSATMATERLRSRRIFCDEARRSSLPVTILHPGHLVGPGWAPINPAGNLNPEIFSRLLQGSPHPAPEHWDGNAASRPCRRCGAMLSRAIEAKQRARRELSRRIAGGSDPAGICRTRRRMVWAICPAAVLTLGRVAAGSSQQRGMQP